jgi:hypothetical protein
MADISISINPAETISANISPPNSISIGPSTSYPPHAPSHAPGAYDSLSSYYAVTGDLTGYVNKNQTGYLSGTFYPYSANPAGYVQGAVVRPSNTGNFVDKSSAVLLTGNQNISGTKNFTYVTALSLQGDLREWDTLIYNEYIYGETINITQNDLNGITINAALPDLTNIINFSGTYSDTFWARFVIPNSGSTINFSSSGPTLLMPHGSGFSGVGYVIEARSVDFNKILIHPISFPSGTYAGAATGYLTGYVNKTETGSFITTSQTGQFVSTGSTGQFVTGSVVRPSQTGAFLTTGAADNRYALQSATGNFVTTAQTGQFVVSSQTGNFVVSSQTGSFLTTGAADNRYALQSATGSFITTAQTGSFSSPIVRIEYQEKTGHFSGLLSGDFRYATTPIANASANLFFSVPITPSNSNSLININAFCLFSSTASTQTTIMIGRSGETLCRYQNTNLPSSVRNDYVTPHVVNWSEIAGTTGIINYEIRAASINSNIFLNRSAGSASYPTNNKSSVLVQEIRPS